MKNKYIRNENIKRIINKKIIKLFMIIMLCFLINIIINKDTFGMSVYNVETEMQIDLKNNINNGAYGSTDHYVNTYSKEIIDNILVATGSIQDYPNYCGFLYLQDISTGCVKEYRLPSYSEYQVKILKDKYNDNVVIFGILDRESSSSIFYMIIDKELNLIVNREISSSRNNSKIYVNGLKTSISGTSYEATVIDEYDNIHYYKIDKTNYSEKYVKISKNSSRERKEIFVHPNGTMWCKYVYDTNKWVEKYVNLSSIEKNTINTNNLNSMKNYLGYGLDVGNSTNNRANVLYLKNEKVFLYGSNYYVIINEKNEIEEQGLLENINDPGKEINKYKNELLINNVVQNELEQRKDIEMQDNVYISYNENEIYTYKKTDNDILEIDSIIDSKLKIYKVTYENDKYMNIIFSKTMSNSQNISYYYIVDNNGTISKINTDMQILLFDKNKIYLSKTSKDNKIRNECIVIGNVTNTIEQSSVIFNNKNNSDSENIYVGNDGLIIEGYIDGKINESIEVSMTVNGIVKKDIINQKNNQNVIDDGKVEDDVIDNEDNKSNNFTLKWNTDELMECTYSNLMLNVRVLIDEYVKYADELKIGDIVCHNGIKYIKINENRYLELYPEESNAEYKKFVTSDDFSSSLTLEEYNKVKEYINQNSGLYRYWLSNGCVVRASLDVNTSPGKKSYNYFRKVVEIDINKKFKYNKFDNTYYECTSDKEIGINLGKKVNVSKKISNAPNVLVTPKSDEYINEDVSIEVVNDENVTTEYVLNNDYENICTYKDIIYLKNSGVYSYKFYNKNINENKSEIVEKIIKIDKDAPNITKVESDNTFDKWTKSNEFTLTIYVSDKESGLSKETIDMYSAEEIKKGEYQIKIKTNVNDEVILTLKDNASNESNTKIESHFKVDNNAPKFIAENFTFDEEGCYVDLQAVDNKSGVKNIFYSVNDGEFTEYDKTKKVFLTRNKYDRQTKFEYYAVDNVNNMTEIYTKILNLNSKPIIRVLNEKELKKNYDLSETIYYDFILEDEDPKDVVLLKVKIEDINGIALHEENIDTIAGKMRYEIPKEFFESLKYEKEYIVHFELSDGEEICEYINKMSKVNMTPKIIFQNDIEEMFEDFIEFDLCVNDLDDELFSLNIYDEKENIIYKQEINNGFNKIILKNVLKRGNQNIKFMASDKKSRSIVTRKINIIKKIEINDDKILIVRLNKNHSKEYFDYIANIAGDAKALLIVLDDNINNLNVINLKKSKLNNVVLEMNNIDDEISMGYITQNVSEEEIQKFILKNKLKISKKVYEKGDEFYATNFIFEDVEGDYYEDKKGKDRIVQIYHDEWKFENTDGIIKDNGKYDYETKEWNKNSFVTYKDFKFDGNILNSTYDEFFIKLDRVGRYIINIKEKDNAIYKAEEYSKYSDDTNFEFYVHRRPEINLNYEYVDEDHIRIEKSSYDLDFYSKNNGIKNEELSMIAKDNFGKVIKEEKIEKNTEYVKIDKSCVTEIKYRVTDYGIDKDVENEYELSNEKTIKISKYDNNVYCNFDYIVGEKSANGYVYKGSEGQEYVKFKEYLEDKRLIDKVEYDIDENVFNESIKNSNSNMVNELKNKVKITDIFGNIYESTENKLLIKNVTLNNVSELNYDNREKGFIREKDALITIELNNAFDDLKVMIDDYEMKKVYNVDDNEKESLNRYEYYYQISDVKTNEFKYKISVFSKRDNSLLIEKEYKNLIYDDVKLFDFNVYKVADPNYKNIFNNEPKYVSKMPIGKDNIKVKKGYSFDFAISSENLDNDSDYVIIKPTLYSYNVQDNIRKKVKMVKESNNSEYIVNIIQNEKMIGDTQLLKLGKEQRFDNIYYGKYFIPFNAKFIYCNDGNEVNEFDEIIVNFQIEAYKDGIRRFAYVPKKWNDECDNKKNSIYIEGDVILYANNKSLRDDYAGMSLY